MDYYRLSEVEDWVKDKPEYNVEKVLEAIASKRAVLNRFSNYLFSNS
jgi:hypothetical protein